MINASIFSLIQKDNLLSPSESTYLQSRTDSFNPVTKPGDLENNYYREYIEGDNLINIQSFLDQIQNTIKNDFAYPHAILSGVWINRVDTTSNHNDGFHIDINKFSSVTFLNDDIEGGLFEYIDIRYQTPQQIRPKKYSTVVFEGSTIPHRVQPVSQGTRYTLVTFWGLESKTTKTLL